MAVLVFFRVTWPDLACRREAIVRNRPWRSYLFLRMCIIPPGGINMSTFFAPISGEAVRNESAESDVGGFIGGRWQPSTRNRRASLHDIHLRPSTPLQDETPPAPIEVPQTYTPTYDPQPQVGYTQGD